MAGRICGERINRRRNLGKGLRREKMRRGCQESATQPPSQPQSKKKRKTHKIKKGKRPRGKM